MKVKERFASFLRKIANKIDPRDDFFAYDNDLSPINIIERRCEIKNYSCTHKISLYPFIRDDDMMISHLKKENERLLMEKLSRCLYYEDIVKFTHIENPFELHTIATLYVADKDTI